MKLREEAEIKDGSDVRWEKPNERLSAEIKEAQVAAAPLTSSAFINMDRQCSASVCCCYLQKDEADKPILTHTHQ